MSAIIRPIHTLVEGRARFYIPNLKRSGRLKDFFDAQLADQADIVSFSVSCLTGKILICYNPVLPLDKILKILRKIIETFDADAALESPKKSKKKGLTGRAMEKVQELLQARKKFLDEKWHTKTPDEILRHFESDIKKGLSKDCVELRRSEFGENCLPKTTARSKLKIFCKQIHSLPFYLLGAAAGVSIMLGGMLDAAIMFSAVLANCVIGYMIESKAEKNIDVLNDLVQHMAEVVRNGESVFIPAEEVVPGDILVFKPGSYVPADSRILSASQLTIDESMLTGESLPAEKQAIPIEDPDVALADQRNMAFMGTCITGGHGTALVVATGSDTKLGQLKILLNNTLVPQTPIERQLDAIGNKLIMMCFMVCIGVFGLGILMGFGVLNMFRMSITLAAAAVPEGLPAMATVNFALGLNRMKKNDIIVRHLPAVETLGAIQTICLDKTGTITKNQMKAVSIYSGEKWIRVEDEGILSNGEPITPEDAPELEKLYTVCALCCETKINGKCSDGRLDISGSATESALTELVDIAGIDVKKIRKVSPLIKINHRSEKRLYMSTIHESDQEDQYLVMVKGSPLEVLARCDFYITNGQTKHLTPDIREKIERANESMARDALRVLGFAYCSSRLDDNEDVETNMTWLGLVGMMDPPRDGIRELVRQFHRAGVRTVMITGDQQISACAIATMLNLSCGEPLDIMDAQELTRLEDDELVERARTVHVYSRVTPSQKLKIVKAIQASGQVVAMTGDGINDSPALKAADIGIAMGKTGTDLARDVADVVLTGDNLELMATALADGRTIYQNIKKSVHFSLATNISEIQLITTAIACGMSSPLNVMQLLWINLISDIFPGLSLCVEQPEVNVMDQLPRESDQELFDNKDFRNMMIESSIMTGSAMGSLFYGISRYGAGARAGGIAFQVLTLGQLLHAVSCRSETTGLFTEKKLPRNNYLSFAVGGSIILQIATMFFSPLKSFLGLSSINAMDGLVIGAASGLPLLFNELSKGIKQVDYTDNAASVENIADDMADVMISVYEEESLSKEEMEKDFQYLCN